MRRLLLALFGGSIAAHLALMWLAPKLRVQPLLGLVLGALLSTSLAAVAAYSGGALGCLLYTSPSPRD